MKANEAPEKLYLIRNISTSTSLNTTNDNHDEFLQEWYKGREKDTDIEYTRTDAFIEKAEKWLRNNQRGFILTDKDITDFVNDMKGEQGVEKESKNNDLCKSCEHYWQDFPMPLESVVSHCEILDGKKGLSANMNDEVPYPCLKCPFNSYIKK